MQARLPQTLSRCRQLVPIARLQSSSVMSAQKGRGKLKVLVTSDRDGSPELEVLERIKDFVDVVAFGRNMSELSHLSDDHWASIEVLLNCGVGERAGKKKDIQEMWPKLQGLQWLHSSSAGLDHLLFHELIESEQVKVTNARGVYSHSLAEYALTCCSWFAKDLPRMRASQKAGKWDKYDVEELRGKTMGVVGYGDIGQACGKLAKAFKMRVIALRRRANLSDEDREAGVLSEVFGNDQKAEMIGQCDYVVMATPFTDATHKMFDSEAVGAMKATAVFVNVGRGKCVDEDALTEALQAGRIRGAGLDVFYTEPLPAESPLWKLDNVLMSAHTADRTKEFQFESMQLFCELVQEYAQNGKVSDKNIVDKRQGY